MDALLTKHSLLPVGPESTRPNQFVKAMDVLSAYLFFLWASGAWFYPLDIQAHTDDELVNSFYNVFTWLCQSFGLYSLVRLGRDLKFVFSEPIFLAFLFWGLASALWSETPLIAVSLFRVLFLFYIIAVMIASKFNFNAILRIQFASAITVLILSIVMIFLTPYGRGEGLHDGAWRGLFPHKNAFGEFCAIQLLLAFVVINTTMNGKRIAAVVALLSFLGLIFSNSATAFGAVGIGISVTLIGAPLGRSNMSMLSKSLTVLAVVGIFSVVFLYSYSTFVEVAGRDMTFSGRTEIWRGYNKLIERAPFLGIGWGSSTSYDSLSRIRDATGYSGIRSAHNSFVQAAYELGYPAMLMLAVWMLGGILSSIVGLSRRALAESHVLSFAVFAAMVFVGMFESTAMIKPSLWLAILFCVRVWQRQISSRLERGSPRAL